MRLARELLAEAQACPALIGRSKDSAIDRTEQPADPFSPLALLRDPTVDIKQYLEDLVSLAASAAQQTDDALAQVRTSNRKARRGMVLVGTFGVVSLLIGITGYTAYYSSTVALTEVRAEISQLQSLQRQSRSELADTSAALPEQRGITKALDVDLPNAAPNPAPAPFTPSAEPQFRNSQPWPDSMPPHRRTPTASGTRAAQHETVVLPQFLARLFR